MNKKKLNLNLIINQTRPINTDGIPIYWKGKKNNQRNNGTYIEELIDDNSQKIVQKYLKWIDHFAEIKIKGTSLKDFLLLPTKDNYSLFYHTIVFEKSPFLNNNIYTIFKLICLEDILKEKQPTDITIHGDEPITTEIIHALADQYNINIVNSLKENKFKPSSISIVLFRALLTLGKQTLQLLTNRFYSSSISPKNVPSNEIAIVTYFPNIDIAAAKEGKFISKYFNELHHYLDSIPVKINWIFFFAENKEVSFSQATKYKKIFNKHSTKDSFFLLEDFIGIKDYIYWIYDIFFSILKYFSIKNHNILFKFPSSNLNLYNLFENKWKHSFFGNLAVYKLLKRREFIALSKKLPQQKFLLFIEESQTWEYSLAAAWKTSQKSSVIGFQHVMCRPLDFRYYFSNPDGVTKYSHILPNCLAVIGERAKIELIKHGFKPEQIMPVDAVRYDYLKDKFQSYSQKPRKNPAEKILIVMAYLKTEAIFQIELLVKALKSMDTPHVNNIIIKYHPFAQHNLDLTELKNLEINVSIENRPISQLISDVDLVYCSNSTSVSQESFWLGVPTIITTSYETFNQSHFYGVFNDIFINTYQELAHELIYMKKSIDINYDFFYFSDNYKYWKELFNHYLTTSNPMRGGKLNE